MTKSEDLMVNITSRNVTYYRNKGYECNVGESIMIKLEDINPISPIKEIRICDYCGQEYTKRHDNHVVTFNRFGKDVCPSCYRNNSEIKKIIQQRREETFIEKYGVSNPSFVPEIVEKISQTTFEHYGVYNASQSEEIKKKQEETMMKLYGARKALQVPQFQEKFVKTMCEGHTVKTSSQQKKCYEMFIQHGFNAVLNYPVSSCSLDILITLENEIKIDFEYDGLFWHDAEQKKKDRKRDEFLKSQGYKIFRVESDKGVPFWDTLFNGIEYLKQNEHNFTCVKIDNNGNVIK